MAFDRRHLLRAVIATLTANALTIGCGKADAAKTKRAKPVARPKPVPKPAPKIVDPAWTAYKTVFLRPDGRIVDTGNNGISHSEGQGYGMLLAEAAADQEAFDSIHGWTEQVLARKDVALFSWRYAPTEAVPVGDPNNAADGDILIAWALMRAHARWHRPEYLTRAAEIRTAVRARLIDRSTGRTLLLPGADGFTGDRYATVNLSYYIWPALDAFHAADRSDDWRDLIDDGETLLAQARFGAFDLPCDWLDVTAAGVRPASGRPPRFGFDAVRIPLYLMLGGRTSRAADVARFWSGCLDAATTVPAWIDVVTGERAPYALSPGGLAIVGRLTKRPVPPATDPATDYYSETLKRLVGL